jgi:hypothetical protein
MDKFKVPLVSSCLNAVHDTSTEVDFVVDSYTGCVHIMDKRINRPFKGYSCDSFERWMMKNENGRHPIRCEALTWISDAWDKCTIACIKNTWRSVGHFFPGEYGDPAIVGTSDTDVSLEPILAIPPICGISHDDIEEEYIEEEDEGGEPLFFHNMGNVLDVDNEESLFVVKLTDEYIARSSLFHSNTTSVEILNLLMFHVHHGAVVLHCTL